MMKYIQNFLSDRYYAIWMENVGDNPTIIARRKIRPTDSTVSYQGKSHVLDLGKPTYRVKNKFFYFVDYTTGQRRIGKAMPKIDNELLDDIIIRKLGRQLMVGISPGMKSEDWMMYIIFAGLGAFATATAMMFYFGGV